MHLWRYLLCLSITAVVHAAGAVEGTPGCGVYQGFTGKWTEVVATAYSPVDPIDGKYHATKGARWRWITADAKTDVRYEPYGIAVPLKPGTRRPYLPFGTRIIVPVETGYLANTLPNDRVFEVDDVGNGRQYFKHDAAGRLHIDLRFRTHESAIQWAGPAGKRVIRVFMVTGTAPADDGFVDPILALNPPAAPPANSLFAGEPPSAPPPPHPADVNPDKVLAVSYFSAAGIVAVLTLVVAALRLAATFRPPCPTRTGAPPSLA